MDANGAEMVAEYLIKFARRSPSSEGSEESEPPAR